MDLLAPMFALLFGVGLFLSGVLRRPRRRVRAGVGALIVLVIVGELKRIEYIQSGLDMYPRLHGASEIEGVWRDGGTELELAASGVWRCRRSKGDEPPCTGTTQTGHWSVDDNTVTFDSPTSTKVAELLVFRYRGSYRLVHNFGDPDDWDYSLDFERVGR
jgi:hypothetical protein